MNSQLPPRRISLKSVGTDDSAFFFRLYSDRETAYWSGLAHFRTEDQASEFIRRLKAEPTVESLLIIDEENREKVGTISLTRGSLYGSPAIEIGYAVLPQYRSQGYMKATLRSVFALLGRQEPYRQIRYAYAKYYADNYKSARLLYEFGFKFLSQGFSIDGYGQKRSTKVVFRGV